MVHFMYVAIVQFLLSLGDSHMLCLCLLVLKLLFMFRIKTCSFFSYPLYIFL